MRILFVNFTPFFGGGEVWTNLVMTELKRRGYSISLFTNSKGKLAQKAAEHQIDTHRFNVRKLSYLDIFLMSRLKKSMEALKPDAIVLNSTFELKVIGHVIKAVGCEKVIFTRGIPKKMKMKPSKKYFFSSVVSHVVVNSEHVKESISHLSKHLRNEPTLIYHGVDPVSEFISHKDSKNIAIVGRLSHEKGVDIAISLMPAVLEKHPDAKLWIIGDGDEKPNLEALTQKLGIEKSVEFFGFVSGVEKVLMKCSMLIMTSRWEGFGLVLLEAMKLYMPSIAFDHLAAKEIIINNETGFLIPDKNPDLMADKINYLLSNPNKLEEMGKKGNDHLREKFTLEKSIDLYEQILNS